MKYVGFLCAVVALLTLGACDESGFTFDTCGSSEFDVQSSGATSTFGREFEFKLSDVPELANVVRSLGSVKLDGVTVQVVSVGADNQATLAGGKLEIGPLDGSSRILVGEYAGVSVAAGQMATLPVSAEAQAFALSALNGGDHAFKVWASGQTDQVPANLRLSVRLTVSGKVGSGGSTRSLACASMPNSTPVPSPACNPNPCKNGGTCSAGQDGVAVCACPTGTGGLQCESFVLYLPLITK